MRRLSAVPFMLTSYRTRTKSRRFVARILRLVGAGLFAVAGLPMVLGRGLMWLAGRANGCAYLMERR